MSNKINQIIERLKSLTLVEAAELVTTIEETFGVDASSALTSIPMTAGTISGTEVEDVEEKTEFTVRLDGFPSNQKIAILKVVRSLTGLGLKEAKTLVESAPKNIHRGVTKELAEDAKKQLEDAGGEVSLI